MTADRFSSTAALRIAACLAALAVAGCNVSDSGNVPCADDSSCPSDYPKCDTTQAKPVCIAGTAPDQRHRADRHRWAEWPPPRRHRRRAPSTSACSPRAGPSGVSSVALTAGSVAATLTTGTSAPTPPLYDFTLDTTKVDMTTVGGVSSTLTATVTGGDKTTATGTATVTVDNVAPTLTGPAGAALAVNTQSALVGTLAGVNVWVSNETLATLTGQVAAGKLSSIPDDGNSLWHLWCSPPQFRRNQ